jgi:peptidoglycan/xylan/chitin deacetylase (PgdA/CDA1 family)
MGNRSGKMILTFDDWHDGNPEGALEVGEYLQGEGITACYFLIGEKAKERMDIVSDLRLQGHYVGSHSYTHARLTELDQTVLEYEISAGLQTNAIRPPYSAWDANVYDTALKLGYTLKLWTVSAGDWREDGTGPNGFRSVELCRAAVRNASADRKANGVIIGHLQTNFPAAVPGIVADMRNEGREFYPNRGPVGGDFPREFI